MQVHQTKFQTIVQEAENAMLIITWQHTQTMSDEIYREELKSQLAYIQAIKPLRMLIDTSHFEFQILPATQIWAAENIFPQTIVAGVKKVAALVPSSFLAQISIERNMEKEESGQLKTRYFDNMEKARIWLLK